MAKILIDYTDTYITGLNTGIQRVVRNILKNRSTIEQITSLETVPVIFAGDFIVKENINKSLELIPKIRKIAMKNHKLYSIVARLYKRFSKYRADILMYKIFGKKAKIEEKDILLLADAFWGEEYNEEFISILSKTNIVSLIYDIIPITNPEVVPEHMANVFSAKVVDIIDNAKLILTISNSEANIIKDFLKSKNIEKPIKSIRLGADIKLSNEVKKPDINIDFENFYLMVGTIEPRKNHLLVLKAFHKIWEEDENTPNLVIAGRLGWKYKEVLDSINSSPFKNKKLFFLENPPDAELEYLYQHTKALIMASIREGFGLPVIEAMVRKVPVVASDIPVFREIAGDYPIYFDPYDVDSLILAIKSSQNTPKKEPNVILNTWEDTARDIAFAIKEHFGL